VPPRGLPGNANLEQLKNGAKSFRRAVRATPRYSRSPHAQPIGEPIRDQQELVNEFLRLACLTYGGDDPARWANAREMLDATPELATASIYTIAAFGEAAAAQELLERDPEAASRQGGPHDWEPLLYLT
jgi:hypothetical protein